MLAISVTAIFTKWAAVPGPASAAIRMMVATSVLTLPYALHQRRSPSGPSYVGLILAALAGLWFAANLGLLNTALLLTSAANATLLDNTAPVWVGLGAWLLFHERLHPRYWLGLLLALAGAAVVSGVATNPSVQPNSGDLIAFGGAVFYAAYLLTMQRAREHAPALSALWAGNVTAAVVLLLVCLVFQIPLLGYSAQAYLSLLAVGIISQTLGWLLINYALGYLPASSAVMILLAQPVVTGLLAVPLLGEPLRTAQVAGGALVLSGIYLTLRQPTGKTAGN